MGSNEHPPDEPAFVVTRRALRRAAYVAAALVVLAGVGIGAYSLGRSAPHKVTSGKTTQTTSSTTSTTTSSATKTATTTVPPTTVPGTFEGPTLPYVMDCGSGPLFKPASFHWCISACSPSMQGINWHNWGTSYATGVGTYVTRTTTTNGSFVPCEQARTVFHPGTSFVLSDPEQMNVCVNGKPDTLWLFRKSSPVSGATAAIKQPPCTSS